jgi:hypothetical protein
MTSMPLLFLDVQERPGAWGIRKSHIRGFSDKSSSQGFSNEIHSCDVGGLRASQQFVVARNLNWLSQVLRLVRKKSSKERAKMSKRKQTTTRVWMLRRELSSTAEGFTVCSKLAAAASTPPPLLCSTSSYCVSNRIFCCIGKTPSPATGHPVNLDIFVIKSRLHFLFSRLLLCEGRTDLKKKQGVGDH